MSIRHRGPVPTGVGLPTGIFPDGKVPYDTFATSSAGQVSALLALENSGWGSYSPLVRIAAQVYNLVSSFSWFIWLGQSSVSSFQGKIVFQ